MEKDPIVLQAVRQVRPDDIAGLRPILEHWIIDRDTGLILPDEIEEVLGSIEANASGDLNRHYVVAEDHHGDIVGVMGLQDVQEKINIFKNSQPSAELINAYVLPDARNQGVGRALVNELELFAKSLGYSELVVNSGPRYQHTGWPFWTAIYGDPVGVAKGLYGPGGDAVVWRKSLV